MHPRTFFRYFFVCRFRNVAAVQDEFLYLFMSLVASLLPTYWSLLLVLYEGHRIPIYHYCVGNDAIGRLLGSENMRPHMFFSLFTFVCYAGVYLVTRVHKKKAIAANAARMLCQRFTPRVKGMICSMFSGEL